MPDEFRFVFVNTKPDTYPCANSTELSVGRTMDCPQPGLSFELFSIYTNAMNINPVISWISDSAAEVGGFDDVKKVWTGAFAKVLNGTIDTLAATRSQTETRDKYFDFSYPFYQANLVYMVRSKDIPVIIAGFRALLSFSPLVWLLYLTAIFILTGCILAASIIYRTGKNSSRNMENKSISDNYNYLIWNFIRYILDKSEGDMRQRNISGNIILVLSGMSAIIMLSLYESSLLAELLTRKETLPFHTEQELARLIKTKEYRLLFDTKFHWYVEELQSNSNLSHYILMRDALKHNPIVYSDNASHGLYLMREGGYIMPTGSDSARLYRAAEYCEIDFISITGTPTKYAQYIFRKNSTLHKRFNNAVISTERLTNRAWEIYYGNTAAEKRVNLCKKPVNQLSPLSLEALIGLFALLLTGAIISFLLFLAEIVVKHYWTLKNNNWIMKNNTWKSDVTFANIV